MAATTPDLYRQVSTAEAADFLGLGARTLEKKRTRGGGPKYVAISRRCVRYRLKDLIDWQESKLRENTAQTDAA